MSGARRRAGTGAGSGHGRRGGDVWGEEARAARPRPARRTEFSDAVAMQLPPSPRRGASKPYFLFGDAQNPVDLWFVDLASKEWRRATTARGSGSLATVEGEDVSAVASYDRASGR